MYSLRNRPEKLAEGLLFCLFLKLVQINFIFTDNVRILYIYAALSVVLFIRLSNSISKCNDFSNFVLKLVKRIVNVNLCSDYNICNCKKAIKWLFCTCELLVFHTKWALFKLYHGEYKLYNMSVFFTRSTSLLDLNIVRAHCNHSSYYTCHSTTKMLVHYDITICLV